MLLNELFDAKLDELEMIPNVNFGTDEEHEVKLRDYLSFPGIVKFPVFNNHYFTINVVPDGSYNRIIVTTPNDNIVGYIVARGLITRAGKALQIYATWISSKHRGMNLAAAIYVTLSKQLQALIVSDESHTASGARIWKRGLPSLGYDPRVFSLSANNFVDDEDPYNDADLVWAFEA